MEKEFKTRNKFIIAFFLILFIVATVNMIILSRSLADYRFFAGDRLRFLPIQECLVSLFSNDKQRSIFLLFEMLLGLMIFYLIYIKIAKPKKFKSDTVEITPKIIIPAPAGQGQFGSKWFMDDIHELAHKELGFFETLFGKKKKNEVFKHNVINYNDERIIKLINSGDEDIRDKLIRLQKLNDDAEAKKEEIDRIRDEIKQERLKQSGFIQDKKDEEQFIEQFGQEDYNGFIEEEQEVTEEEIIDSLDIIEQVSEELDLNEYENNIELHEEYLNQKYVKQIRDKNDKELEREKPYNANNDKNKLFKQGGLIVGIYNNKKKKEKSSFF